MRLFIAKYKIELAIVLLFVLSRAPDLGYDMFNTDVWKWKARSYDFGTGVFSLDFGKTIQKYHPGVTLMWLGTLGIKLYNLYYDLALGHPPLNNNIASIFELHAVQKYLVVFVIGLALAFIYRPLKDLFGRKYALTAVFLISVEPFFVALSRAFHLEGMMSIFMVASFVWFYFYLEKESKNALFISAFFSALAFLTKTSALFMIVFIPFMLLLYNRNIKAISVVFIKWFAIYVLTFIIFWPALYTHAWEALQTLYRGILTIGIEREHPQLFLNQWVDDPGWVFYIAVFFFRASPYLLIGLIGGLLKPFAKERSKFLTYTLLFGLLYTLELSIPSKKLDRYLLPTFIAYCFIAADYFIGVINSISKFKKETAVLFISLPILLLYYIHPNYFSFYSPFLGGSKVGIYVLESKWMFGQKEITSYFEQVIAEGKLERFEIGQTFDSLTNKKEIEYKLTVGFQEKYYTQIWPFVESIGGRASIKDLTAHAKQTNYFVYPIYDDDSYLEDRFEIEFVDNIYVRGFPVYNVYRRIN